jgi:uncharacterized protein YrrD
MCTRVRSHGQTTYATVTSADMVQVADIVFWEVQLGNRFYAHLVKRKEWHDGDRLFTGSNSQGRVNGWCRI